MHHHHYRPQTPSSATNGVKGPLQMPNVYLVATLSDWVISVSPERATWAMTSGMALFPWQPCDISPIFLNGVEC